MKSYIEPEQEIQAEALEERLRESEAKRLAQKREIGELQAALCELNRNVMALEKRNFHMELALIVSCFLLTSASILVYNMYHGDNLVAPYYVVGKTYLNALLANPIFCRFYL